MCLAYGEVWFLIERGRVDYFTSYFYRKEEASCAMEYCNGCGRDVSVQQEKKRRRLLSSTGLRPVLHTLKKFHSDFTQESMEELLPGGFICRSCVRVIKRYYNSPRGSQ